MKATNKPSLAQALKYQLLLAAGLPLLLFGTVVLFSVGQKTSEAFQARGAELAHSIAARAERPIVAASAIIHHLSHLLVQVPPEHLDGVLRGAVEESEQLNALFLLSPALKVTHVGLPKALIHREADLLGLDLRRLPPLDQLKDAPVQTLVWSSAQLSPLTARLALAVAVKLKDGQVLYANLGIDSLKTLVSQEAARSEAEVAIVDQTGRVFAHSNEQASLSAEILEHLRALSTADNFLTTTHEFKGEDGHHVGSVARLDKTGWLIHVGRREADAQAPVTRILTLLFGILLMALGFSFASAAMLGQAIARPMTALAESARALAEGKYGLSLPKARHAELDILGESLSDMAAAVQAREAELIDQRRILEMIAEATASSVGQDFFTSLTAHLAEAFKASIAAIVELGEKGTLKVLAGVGPDGPFERVEYALDGTPCQWALREGPLYVERAVTERFPDAKLLKTLGQESYVAMPLLDPAGVAIGLLMLADRRPRRFGEQARSVLRIFAARAAAELAQLRAKRAQEAMESKMREAGKLEALGRLAGGVAHDFNNQLTVMLGYADLLERQLPEGVNQQAAAEIRKAARRSADLTSQLLAFGRRQVLAPRTVDLGGELDEMKRMLERLLGSNIRFEVSACSGLYVSVDPGLFHQAIVNLVVNARDAMPDGGLLTVKLDQVTHPKQPRPLARVQVSDTGQGMTGETLAQIFEPFFTTKALGKGTGLGLAMVHGFLEQSGGFITVDSQIGRGSSFCLHLPLVEFVQGELALLEQPAISVAGLKVLVADDDAAVRGLAVEALTRAGVEVLQAADGAAALTLFRATSGLDAVITDVMMPNLDGLSLAAAIRATHPDFKILFVTGYAAEHFARRGDGLKGQALLIKPFHAEALVTALSRRMRS